MKSIRLKKRHLVTTTVAGVPNWWSDAQEWTPLKDKATRYLRVETALRKAGSLRNRGYDANVSTISE